MPLWTAKALFMASLPPVDQLNRSYCVRMIIFPKHSLTQPLFVTSNQKSKLCCTLFLQCTGQQRALG